MDPYATYVPGIVVLPKKKVFPRISKSKFVPQNVGTYSKWWGLLEVGTAFCLIWVDIMAGCTLRSVIGLFVFVGVVVDR